MEEEAKEKEEGHEVVIVRTKETMPREFYIKKKDAEKHGYTRGCGGCSSWFRGLGRQPHTEGCRERFRKLMEEEDKVRNAAKRRAEFEEKEFAKCLRKEERKVKRDREEQEASWKKKAKKEGGEGMSGIREEQQSWEGRGGESRGRGG